LRCILSAAVPLFASSRQQMSLQIDTSDVDYELMREREDALQQLEVRCLFFMLFMFFVTSLHATMYIADVQMRCIYCSSLLT